MPREIERKYDVSTPASLPDLTRADGVAVVDAPVQHDLEAVYFDTEDLALARARLTLRRRTGGTDAGWHLKRPAGGDREETHAPLGRSKSAVPDKLAAQVRSRTRGRPLAPVATLRTSRVVHHLLDEAGVVLAEVADDTVTAETRRNGSVSVQSWREWEVELVNGDRELLDAVEPLLAAAGAKPAAGPSKLARALGDEVASNRSGPVADAGGTARAGDVLLVHLREQVEELLTRDPAVRRDDDDAVHKMRVATRRLRSALSTFRPLLDRAVSDPVREELKWLAGVLGEARDAEVMRDRLLAAVAREPGDLVLGAVVRRITVDLGGAYRDAHARVVETLDGERYLRLLDALDALVTSPPWTDRAGRAAGDVLPQRAGRAYDRLRLSVEAVESAPTPALRDERLHDVRKEAKRARYAGEALVPAFGAPAQDFANAAKVLQEVLGDHQDSVVTRDVLRRLGVQAHLDGDNGFTYGRLHALEQARGVDTDRAYAEAWGELSRKRLRRWMR